MITTVTLNPAFDLTITVNGLAVGNVQTSVESKTHLGGKGINVSKLSQEMGFETCTFAVTAGEQGKLFERLLKNELPFCDFYHISRGNTRKNL